MNTITLSENKTLKLQNVLSVQVDLESESDELFDIEINKLNTYIQTSWALDPGGSLAAYIDKRDSTGTNGWCTIG
nr:hypothetical protein [uncultured Agathobacter sp.]